MGEPVSRHMSHVTQAIAADTPAAVQKPSSPPRRLTAASHDSHIPHKKRKLQDTDFSVTDRSPLNSDDNDLKILNVSVCVLEHQRVTLKAEHSSDPELRPDKVVRYPNEEVALATRHWNSAAAEEDPLQQANSAANSERNRDDDLPVSPAGNCQIPNEKKKELLQRFLKDPNVHAGIKSIMHMIQLADTGVQNSTGRCSVV